MFSRTAEWRSENGLVINFGDKPFVLRDIVDNLGANAQVVKAPGQDGATTYLVTLGQLSLNLVGSIHASRDTIDNMRASADKLQEQAKKAFAPNRFGLLVDNRPGGSRQIRCRPIETPTFGSLIQGSRTLDIEFIADTPYWESVNTVEKDLGLIRGGFRFPLHLPTIMGLYLKGATIMNESGDEVWPEIEIFTVSEYVAVNNITAGKKIEINHPIGQNQKLLIDTKNTRATIMQLGDNGAWEALASVENWLTTDSEYFPLLPGANEITLNNETQGANIIAKIRYRVPM
jgi:phage-related protein